MMPQIDVVLKFPSFAAAKADSIVRKYRDEIEDLWSGDSVIPDIKVWRVSQDVGGVHTYQAGFFVLVSLPRVVNALKDHAAVQFAVNREKMNARQGGMVLRKTVSDVILNDFRFSPVFAGMHPPWGAWL